MNTDRHDDVYVVRIRGLVDGTPTDFAGQYIVEYDPSRAGVVAFV